MHPDDPMKEPWMYPHVVQFETRRRQLARELRLIHERTQARARPRPSATRTEPALHGRPASQGADHRELERELTIERTLA
jgi:hypothetical protein